MWLSSFGFFLNFLFFFLPFSLSPNSLRIQSIVSNSAISAGWLAAFVNTMHHYKTNVVTGMSKHLNIVLIFNFLLSIIYLCLFCFVLAVTCSLGK